MSARLQEKLRDFNATGAQPYQLSLSFGLTAVESAAAISVEDVIAMAHKAMYEDKRRKQISPAESIAPNGTRKKENPGSRSFCAAHNREPLAHRGMAYFFPEVLLDGGLAPLLMDLRGKPEAERGIHNPRVGGSIPPPAMCCG